MLPRTIGRLVRSGQKRSASKNEGRKAIRPTGLELWKWRLLPGSTKLVFNTGDSLAQVANFALGSYLTS